MSRAIPPPSATRGRIVGCSPDDIAEAAALLKAGDLVGMPTETVYGLAADATDGLAVARIYEAKGRPSFNPLIAHVPDLAKAQRHGLFNADALRLAEAFWPGPLTLVTPFRAGSPISNLARAGLDSVALRVPSHPAALALLRATGRPIAAPSANRSGRVSPTQAADVIADLGERVALVLDAGPCALGLESTILSCLDGGVALLRPGGLPREAIEETLGRPLAIAAPSETVPVAPGQLTSHYAPLAPLRMDAAEPGPDEAFLDFWGSRRPRLPAGERYFDLSAAGDLREAAARLFSALRRLDASRPAAIAVAPIPAWGLGEAINDRLRRAAAPRG